MSLNFRRLKIYNFMDGPLFILSHEAAVSLHIRTEDGRELAFNFLYGHGIPQRLVGRLV
jgi:hypothetical protein